MTTLDYLNRYSNLLIALATLLLVVVTAIYVLLTWRTLKALERANRRDLELRHLVDIKQGVAEPLLAWLDNVAATLQGKLGLPNSLLWIGTDPFPRLTSRIDESPYDYEWKIKPAPTLWEPGTAEVLGSSSATGGIMSTQIFTDAQRQHFRKELSQLLAFLQEWRTFLSVIAAFATNCAHVLQGTAPLPHLPATGYPEEFANADYLVARCLRQFLSGTSPHFAFTQARPELITVRDPNESSQVIAQGREEKVLRSWIEQGSAFVAQKWSQDRFPERAADFLRKVNDTYQSVGSIRLSHFLPGDCQYIGGRGRNDHP